jgi:hypothetical protein
MDQVRRSPESLSDNDMRQAEISHRWSVVLGISTVLAIIALGVLAVVRV